MSTVNTEAEVSPEIERYRGMLEKGNFSKFLKEHMGVVALFLILNEEQQARYAMALCSDIKPALSADITSLKMGKAKGADKLMDIRAILNKVKVVPTNSISLFKCINLLQEASFHGFGSEPMVPEDFFSTRQTQLDWLYRQGDFAKGALKDRAKDTDEE